jgi:hypothetical protein
MQPLHDWLTSLLDSQVLNVATDAATALCWVYSLSSSPLSLLKVLRTLQQNPTQFFVTPDAQADPRRLLPSFFRASGATTGTSEQDAWQWFMLHAPSLSPQRVGGAPKDPTVLSNQEEATYARCSDQDGYMCVAFRLLTHIDVFVV